MEPAKAPKELTKTRIKVAYRFPYSSAYTIHLVTIDKATQLVEYLANDGTVVQGNPTDLKPAASISLSNYEPVGKMEKNSTPVVRPYAYIEYVIEAEETYIESKEDRVNNYMALRKHQFIVRMMNAHVPDKNGANTNANMRTPLFDVIDESNNIRMERESNELVTKCLSIANEMVKKDEKGFVDLCYALNIPNIHTIGSTDALYNKVAYLIKNNPVRFDEVYNSGQKSLLAMISRALYQPLANGQTALEIRDGYYQMDNLAICKVISGPGSEDKINAELLHFFNTNPNALKALERKMGVYIERQKIEPLAESVNPGELDKGEKDIRDKINKAAAQENSLKNVIYIKVEELKKNNTAAMRTTFAAEIDKLKSDNPEFEKFITNQVEYWIKILKIKTPAKEEKEPTEAK